ncbi:hypothetical protein KVR01_009295 [Diaporthe batatas]|uniref:uncharacterized protein n=1 Tax=Diaporthe batatas TaxID=748121 RepID=UPI001D059DD1|nr:uncharacterized protein KVR01_009295 [Diaporthe batatas]KAG8161031.1 hypothetical protein KVR01_009295 [Diaporthe batatas]
MDGKTKLNQDFFDNEAASYDAKHEKTTAEIARRIEARRGLIGVQWVEDDEDDSNEEGRAVRVLDYACGTGSMSRAFAPYTTQCVGIDLSEKMVDMYNTRARNQGLSEDEMVAFQGNLCVPGDEDPESFRDPKFSGFDLAVIGLGFHHFDNPDLAAKRLAARLRPGGVLMILDFLPHAPHGGHDDDDDHHHHHHHHHHHGHDDGHGHQGGADVEAAVVEKALETVTHHGFSEERIREVFVGAGVGKDFLLEGMGQVKFGEKHGKRTLFLARGTKE